MSTRACLMPSLAAFSRFLNNEERSDLTVVITTEQPQTCRERLQRRGALEAPRKRRRRTDEQDATRQPDERMKAGGHASGAQGTTSAPPAGGETPAERAGAAAPPGPPQAAEEAAGLEAPSPTGFTAVELHGHGVVLGALSEYFDKASSRNNFNKRAGCEDDSARKFVVVSVGSEEEIEAATLMVKSMYGIQLPEDVGPDELVRVLTLADKYRVEPALCNALQLLQRAMEEREPESPTTPDNDLIPLVSPSTPVWLCSWPPALVRALYCRTGTLRAVYDITCDLLPAEAQCAAGDEASTAGQQLRASAEGIMKELRNVILDSAERWAGDFLLHTIPCRKVAAMHTMQEWYCSQPAAAVVRLLSNEELSVVCEQTVFAAAMLWLQANRDASTADRRAVWNCIRLLDLSPWALTVVLGGLPEAGELMDPGSLQHLAACALSGDAMPPLHVGLEGEGCSYETGSLAWTQRKLSPMVAFISADGPISEDLFANLIKGQELGEYLWRNTGLQYVLTLQVKEKEGGDMALLAKVVVLRPAWLGSHAKALRVGIDAGKFAVQAGAEGTIRVMDGPPPGALRNGTQDVCMASACLGTFPKAEDAAAHLRRLLAGTGDRPQLRVLKCDDAGVPLVDGVIANDPGQPRYRGPSVRLLQPGA